MGGRGRLAECKCGPAGQWTTLSRPQQQGQAGFQLEGDGGQ